jgi:curved DNA-binding protein CbpA
MHSQSTHNPRSTYYDVLGLDPTSTACEIRKAYLKKSLQHHPDKNPTDPELAKARFVEIGAAYETLSDPVKRHQYDQKLLFGWQSSSPSTNNASGGCSGPDERNFSSVSEQSYDNYRDIFDATVAGMSEEELAAVIGTVATVAGIMGSIIGSRVLNGGRSRGARCSAGAVEGGSNILSLAGSMIGSVVAKEVAVSSVRALHQESVQRLAYKEECQRALARGERIPDPPRKINVGDVVQRTLDSVKNAIQHSMEENHGGNSQSRGGGNQHLPFSDVWNMAVEGVRAAANETKRHATNR